MNKRTLTILGVILGLDLLFAGGLWYGVTLMHDLKTSEKDVTQKLAVLDSKADQQATLRKTLASVEEERKRLDPFFYDDTDESGLEFVKDIEQLGKTAGITLDVNTATFTGTTPNKFRMDLRFSGPWSKAYRFIELLETFPARLSITRFNLAADGNPKNAVYDGNWSGNVTIELLSIRKEAKQK